MKFIDRLAARLGYVRPGATPRPGGRIRAGFEASETPSYAESFSTRTSSVNEDLARELPTQRARAVWLSRNNEYARRYQLLQRANVLGSSGIRLQMHITRRDGTLNDRLNERLETAWRDWGRRGSCEVTGRSWRTVERILLDGISRDGEILIRQVNGHGPHRIGFQVLNPSVLDVSLHRDWQGRRVRMGVEVDDLGRPVAYWLRAVRTGDSDSTTLTVGAHVRVDASQIIHRFVDEEIDQFRGFPALSVGSRRLWLAQEFETAAAVASRNAAQRLGFFVTPTGEAPAGVADLIVHQKIEEARAAGRTLTAAEIETIQSEAQKFSTSVPGQYDVLPEGVQFEQYKSDYPNVNHGDYVNHAIRSWSAGQGVSYVTVGNNLEAVNYSSARVGILDEREQWKMVQEWFIENVLQEVFERWLSVAILSVPALAVLNMERVQEYVDATSWQPRRWQGIDPIKEESANELRLKNRLTSRRRIIMERGDDPDEIAAEIEREEATYGPVQASPSPAAPADPSDPPDDEDAAAQPSAKGRLRVA